MQVKFCLMATVAFTFCKCMPNQKKVTRSSRAQDILENKINNVDRISDYTPHFHDHSHKHKQKHKHTHSHR